MKRRDLHDRQGRKIPAQARHDSAFQHFIDNVDDAAFTAALEDAADAKYQSLLRARLDPRNRRTSFSKLCRNFGISIADVDDLYRKSQIHIGMIRSANHIPDLMEDIAIDAKSKLQYCTRCDGKGIVTDLVEDAGGSDDFARSAKSERGGIERMCPMCKGVGEVRVAGDRTARDLVYESIGLIGRKGPMVAIQNNLTLDSELGELLANSQKVLAGRTDDRETDE
jgi:hypothetical protein